ncbi:hypothetical protein GOQ30_10430 [Flavobacterium sp. TP390]|uniref:Uncharacterized protein n=1 Tax=Flavobacterium profundi TaxID=1774945 RepID=A0A6I4IIQ2_9FLAO|nr:hypothetical protein [Flavobacterium profundi]MVO09575.1 hypothetical protein [Flavobacterium profundi]
MRNKLVIVNLLFLFNMFVYGQEFNHAFDLKLKGNRDVFQVVDSITNTVTMFFSDKEKVTAIRLNHEFQIIDTLSADRPESKYEEILGYNRNGNQIGLIWAKSNKTEIIEQGFDFSDKKIVQKKFSLELKKQTILPSVSINDCFYLMTCNKIDLTINLYIIKDGKLDIKKINLKEETFYNSSKRRTHIYDLFTEIVYPENIYSEIQVITKNNLVSLKSTSAKRKLYVSDNEMIFTFDNHLDVTQCIFINLNSFDYTLKYFKKPSVQGDDLFFNSNSYIFNNQIFQIKTTEEEFYLTLKDRDDNLLKTHHLKKSDSLYFKNSPVFQENGDFGGKREFDKSSKFIRKINSLNCGLTVHNFNNNYLITIGGLSTTGKMTTGVFVGGSMFGATGALIGAALSPALDSFNSYANQKVVYTNCLFDKSLNHLEGDVPLFAFDQVRSYLDGNKNLKLKTLFKVKDVYYLGFYQDKQNQYCLKKFDDLIK